MRSVEGIGRPAWLITTGTREDYEVGEGVEVCTIPKAPEGFEFIEPMLNHVPDPFASYLPPCMMNRILERQILFTKPLPTVIRRN